LDNQLATLTAHNASLASQDDEHERILVSNLRDVLERQREGKPSGPSKRVVAGGTGRKEREEREEDMDIDDSIEWTKRNRKYVSGRPVEFKDVFDQRHNFTGHLTTFSQNLAANAIACEDDTSVLVVVFQEHGAALGLTTFTSHHNLDRPCPVTCILHKAAL